MKVSFQQLVVKPVREPGFRPVNRRAKALNQDDVIALMERMASDRVAWRAEMGKASVLPSSATGDDTATDSDSDSVGSEGAGDQGKGPAPLPAVRTGKRIFKFGNEVNTIAAEQEPERTAAVESLVVHRNEVAFLSHNWYSPTSPDNSTHDLLKHIKKVPELSSLSLVGWLDNAWGPGEARGEAACG